MLTTMLLISTALATDAPHAWEDGMAVRTPTSTYAQVAAVAELQGSTRLGFGDLWVGAPVYRPDRGPSWGLSARATGVTAWVPDEERSTLATRGVGGHVWMFFTGPDSINGISLGYEANPGSDGSGYALYHPGELTGRLVGRYDGYVDNGRLDWAFTSELSVGEVPALAGSVAGVWEASERVALTLGAQLGIQPVGRVLLGANVRPVDGVELRAGAHVPVGLYTAQVWLPEPSLQLVLHR